LEKKIAAKRGAIEAAMQSIRHSSRDIFVALVMIE
jgi:hypothetical protein